MANIDPPMIFAFKLIEFVVALVIVILLNIYVITERCCLVGEGTAFGYIFVALIILICFIFLDPLTSKQNIIFCAFGAVVYMLVAALLGCCWNEMSAGEVKDMVISAVALSLANAVLMLVESILGCLGKDGISG